MAGAMLHAHPILLADGEPVHPHAHDGVHLCVVRAGALREWIDGRERVLRAGDVRVSPAGAVHELEIESGGFAAWMLEFGRPLRPSERAQVFRAERSTALRAALARGDGFAAECAALELVAAARGSAGTPPAWLRRLRTALDADPAVEPSLRQWAERVGRHPSHVARSFETHFGRSLGEHVRARRLWSARQRVRATDEPLCHIAVDHGFCDQAHFTHAFRRHFGISPGRARRG